MVAINSDNGRIQGGTDLQPDPQDALVIRVYDDLPDEAMAALIVAMFLEVIGRA